MLVYVIGPTDLTMFDYILLLNTGIETMLK